MRKKTSKSLLLWQKIVERGMLKSKRVSDADKEAIRNKDTLAGISSPAFRELMQLTVPDRSLEYLRIMQGVNNLYKG